MRSRITSRSDSRSAWAVDILRAVLTSTLAALAVSVALQGPPAPPPTPAPQAPLIETAWPDDKPITRIAQNFVHDFLGLTRLEPALVLGSGGLGAIVAHTYDDDVAEWAAESPSALAGFGRVLGDGWFQGSLAFLTYGVGFLNDDAKTRHIGSDLIRTQVLTGALTRSLKVIVDRERPYQGGLSFPSGHASATFATATVLYGHFGWKVGLPGYALASLVAWNRVRDRSHWLSDTVFGASIGLAAGLSVTRGHRERTWVVTPVASRHSVAIHVSRRGR